MGTLCLSARNGDYFMLVLPDGRTIRIDVEMYAPRQVRLQFSAPQDVRIWRDENWERLQDQEAKL